MQTITGVIFDEKPLEVTVYPTSVYVAKNITEVQVADETNDGESVMQTKYQADCDVYEHHEYITIQNDQYVKLRADQDELMLAMNELVGGES